MHYNPESFPHCFFFAPFDLLPPAGSLAKKSTCFLPAPPYDDDDSTATSVTKNMLSRFPSSFTRLTRVSTEPSGTPTPKLTGIQRNSALSPTSVARSAGARGVVRVELARQLGSVGSW